MGVVPPRQVVILSISNYEDICTASGNDAAVNLMSDLREIALSCGVDPGHMRKSTPSTILVRLDNLPRETFLERVRCMATKSQHYARDYAGEPIPCIRVGAMSERALRSFVNDVANDLLAHMDHMDCPAAFLAGDELDVWRELESTDIELLSHEQLKHLDPFTGLLKEERFFSLLKEALTQLDDQNAMSVLYLDIDDFKSYNRTFGHEAGDALLLFVSHQLHEAFSSDIVCHINADKFAVLTGATDIVLRCASVHEAVRTFKESFAPELKCGVYEVEPDQKSPYVALDCAKLACESIKGRYDVSCRMFDDELRERLFTRRYVARYAEQAVNERWIHAYAQPIVDTKTNELCGFEALARWMDPMRGILSPAVFIPTLEDAHLIHKLDGCIVEDVCRHLSERLAAGLPVIPASVNLSRLDFQLCDILDVVQTSCARWNIPHNLLAVEITESALDTNSSMRTEMDRFRAAGFEVWMDDFGCGYSSLNLLKDYEFDVLKVDMEFLRDMEGNKRSQTIVTSVIAMAKSLGIRTLVEGVETTTQRDFLRAAGADMMQGYLFDRPQPLDTCGF